MFFAAQGLVKYYNIDVSSDPEKVFAEFNERFHDTKIFHDPFGGPRFVHYYHHAHEERANKFDKESANRRLQESQLFIEAAHSCYLRMTMETKPKSGLLAKAEGGVA
jgi:sulfite reductase (ferredoxin)